MKTFIFIVIAILIIALGFVSYKLYEAENAPVDTTAAKVPADIKQQVIKTYTDSLTHQTHVIFSNKLNNLPAASLTNGTISKPLLDSISKSLDIKSNQVTGYIKLNEVSQAKDLKATKTIDSLKRIVYYYQTKYIKITFNEPDSLHKDGSFSYKHTSDLTAIQHTGRKFLGIPIGKDVIDVSSTDTSETYPGGLSAFSINPSAPFFGAQLQGLGQYNVKSKFISPGVGLQLRFGKLYITAGEYYNTGTNKYNTLVGGRVGLFQLLGTN